MVLGFISQKIPAIQPAMLDHLEVDRDVCIWQKCLLANTHKEIQVIR